MSVTVAFLTFVLLTYGASVRINSLPGLIPLSFFWATNLFSAQSVLKRCSLATATLLFIFCCHWVVVDRLVRPEKMYAENKLFLQDLTGIFVKTGENVFPDLMYKNPYFDTADLRRRYDPATFDHIWWGKDYKVTVIDVKNQEMRATLRSAWMAEVLKHPVVYICNRMEGFLFYLRIKNSSRKFVSYYMGTVPNDLGLSFHRNMVSSCFVYPVVAQKSMPYMRPWFWFFLNFTLLIFAPLTQRGAWRLGFKVVLWSGILYQLPSFFIFQIDTDFRYFYWNCICCSVAICILLANKYTGHWHDRIGAA